MTTGDARDGRVTVVMPTHNRSSLVGRAIRSVLAQTHTDWELIVVDDGSKDDTREVLGAFRDPRIRYVKNEMPTGPAEARNTGVRAAGPGGFLAFLDDDDEWLPRKLELQLALFRTSAAPLVGVGCGRIDILGGEPDVYLPQYRGDVFEHLLARRARGYGAQQILVRRKDGEKDQLFDLDLPPLEDLDYSMQLSLKGPFDFVPEPLVKIYREEGARPHVWNAEAAIRGYERLARKYESELKRRPWIRSYYDVCIARDLAALGRMRECRRRLRQAAEGSPNRARLVAWYGASIAGGLGIRAAARLFPIGPPPNRTPLPGPDAEPLLLLVYAQLNLFHADLLRVLDALNL